MKFRTTALLFSLGLAIASSGCIVLARETYTSLSGPDAVAIEPATSFDVSPGREGHSLSHSPSLARAGSDANASVTAAVCDWDPGVWFVVFPPLPVPLLSPGDGVGRPGTTLVRLTLDASDTWRASLGEFVLEGAAGLRAVPDRYELVTRRLDDSTEPCSPEVSPRTSIDGAELAIFGKAELWLSFPTLDWPDSPRSLEIGGLTLGEKAWPASRLEFDSGARWFWYRVFP